MRSKHAIVIDKNGHKVDLVLVNYIDENGEIKPVPYSYTMQDGECLIFEDIPATLSMLKPRWNVSAWEETATPEEIAAAQLEPIERHPSETDIIMLAVAELYEKFDKVLGGEPA